MGLSLPTYWLSIGMALASLISILLAWRTLTLSPFPGRNTFALSMLASAWWSASVAVEHANSVVDSKVFWAEMAWVGIVASPGSWALFVWNYIHGQTRPAPRSAYLALLAIALLVWALALSNGSHHLMYRATVAAGEPPAMTVNYFHGPLYFVVAAGFYALLAFSEALILYEIVRANDVYRTHYLGFAAASLLPWFFNVGYATRTITVGTADLTPLSFVAMNMILVWLIGRRHLFELVPIAHDTLLAAIPDPVLVLDSAQRIAESNPAARQLAGDHPLNGFRLNVVPELGASLDANAPPSSEPREVAIGNRYFDMEQVDLSYRQREIGRLILLRDISHRKEAESRLQKALADLERQLEHNLALQEQLREQAIRDPLTGLHNRRFFDELSPVVLAEAQRAGTPLAAAMIDLDRFKKLNDTHGHAAGDAVLRATGAFLRSSIRQSDLVFRMGGEEFLILLPRTPDDQALRRVDEWRAAFAAASIDHEGKKLAVTFSVGIAMFPGDANGVEELLGRADEALYRAKNEGRNRTVRWSRN